MSISSAIDFVTQSSKFRYFFPPPLPHPGCKHHHPLPRLLQRLPTWSSCFHSSLHPNQSLTQGKSEQKLKIGPCPAPALNLSVPPPLTRLQRPTPDLQDSAGGRPALPPHAPSSGLCTSSPLLLPSNRPRSSLPSGLYSCCSLPLDALPLAPYRAGSFLRLTYELESRFQRRPSLTSAAKGGFAPLPCLHIPSPSQLHPSPCLYLLQSITISFSFLKSVVFLQEC